MALQSAHIRNGYGDEYVTVYLPGREPLSAHNSHPNFDAILDAISADDENVVRLFDVGTSVVENFNSLSDRVTYANGILYFDGDPLDNAVAGATVRALNDGLDDWQPLVNFIENVYQNPSERSRDQLYTWLSDRDFTINDEGWIVAYKGVYKTDDGFKSIHSGRARVNGQVQTGQIPQDSGDVVEMPRSEVSDDAAQGCHHGLHVGTYDFAQGFAHGALLEVLVNPRDVVSVPSDAQFQKMRVCRYYVVDVIDAPHTALVSDSEAYVDFNWWGDGEDDDSIGNVFDY